ncbi:hypothetical protein FXO38_24807 [Capsicum annuum]|nr:hypothetical protein FXO38_24807 [Capsicum annuum]
MEQVTPEQVERRSSRTIRVPGWYLPLLYYLLLTDEGKPESVAKALQVEDSIKWKQAMDDEKRSLENNNTWILAELPTGKRVLLNKRVISRFRGNDAKPRTTPLANHIKLSKDKSPKTAQDPEYMEIIPYASAVRSLMYDMLSTRPDIVRSVGVVSRYMAKPGKEHWEVVKWLLRYLRGTSSTSLCFYNCKVIMQGFVDADLSGDMDPSKSTFGYIYTIGSLVVILMSRLQKFVALSSIEAEYVTLDEAKKEIIWLADYLEELGKKQREKILYIDS